MHAPPCDVAVSSAAYTGYQVIRPDGTYKRRSRVRKHRAPIMRGTESSWQFKKRTFRLRKNIRLWRSEPTRIACTPAPPHLVEEYRKTLHGAYRAVHGEESFRNPTAEEWAAFTASCSLRDMGTHMCALPTGEHCSKGLVCLGCVHAQPKKSAIPVFRRMLMSHERELHAAKKRGEPAGQIAARELEVERIRQALRRAEELTMDVAAAIEEMARTVDGEEEDSR